MNFESKVISKKRFLNFLISGKHITINEKQFSKLTFKLYEPDKGLDENIRDTIVSESWFTLKNLNSINEGKTKKPVGGFLLGFGIGAMIGDLAGSLYTSQKYPSTFTYIGAFATIISIPVLIGRHNAIRSAVDGHNENLKKQKTSFKIE